MVAPAIVASLAAAVALFHRPAIAFLAAVTIEVARNLSVRWAVPHAGYTSGVAVVLLVAAAFYASRYLVLWRMRPG
jgi:mannose/fructose/N-acetylgalactosamine-specific phosphotransferase system component IID